MFLSKKDEVKAGLFEVLHLKSEGTLGKNDQWATVDQVHDFNRHPVVLHLRVDEHEKWLGQDGFVLLIFHELHVVNEEVGRGLGDVVRSDV